MPRISFLQPNGKLSEVDAPLGVSLLRLAQEQGIEGLVAECGGTANCATCHVYVDPKFVGRMGTMSTQEDAVLQFTASERTKTSRLSCQIIVEPLLDGLVVRVPDKQI